MEGSNRKNGGPKAAPAKRALPSVPADQTPNAWIGELLEALSELEEAIKALPPQRARTLNERWCRLGWRAAEFIVNPASRDRDFRDELLALALDVQKAQRQGD